jgi:predicted RNase H-like HicB family nuclease
MELKVRVRAEEGAYWAEVEELPGCFASGRTLDELVESLTEAVFMYLDDDRSGTSGIERRADRAPAIRIEELRVEVPEARTKVSA